MSLQIRRGTDAERLTITPLTAELIYTTDTQLVYVGDGVTVGGILVGSGGGNGNYGNANVVSLLNSGLAGNIIPAVDNLYSLGNATNQWADLYVSNNTIYLDNIALTGNATTLSYAGTSLISANGTSNISTTGNITGENLAIGAVGGRITFGDGTFQTTAAVSYANANVAAFLASGTDSSNIVTTANVSASHIIGNGSALTSLTGTNVTGAVPFATTANAVAGANVAGEVAHAAVANLVAGANVSGQVSFAATANLVSGANVSGQVGNALVSGTVYTAAQPNITSVGTLTGLSVSGNINAGTNHITNVSDPLLAQDAATKAYVDARASGLSIKTPVALATVAPLSLTYSYNNGVAGVGAYILGTTVGQLFIDGIAATVGSRVLIKNEVGAFVNNTTPSAAFNGIYVVLDDGVSNAFQLERSTDCDTTAEIPSAYTLVNGGTLINTSWVDNNVTGMTVGTTEITFVQFSSVTTYSGGSAIDVTGSVISAKYDGTTIVTNGSNQLEVGTVPGTSISGTVASATVAASANSVAGANVSGEVAFAATANLVAGANVSGAVGLADFATTANAVAGANVSGEVSFAAVANTVAGANVSGTVSSATVAASANTVAGANVTGQVANALVAGTVYTAAQPNITSVGTLTTLGVTGNVTGDYFIGNGSQLTGLPAGYANSDVANYLASNANVVITTTGNITTTANVEAGFFIGDGSQLTNLPPAQAVSIPAVYFNVVADGNNQTFSNTILSAYNSNTDITLFYNGSLLDSPYYTLSGDTITVNTDLTTGDSIDIIRQFASNVVVSTYGNSNVYSYLESSLVGNIIPAGNNIASLGTATNQFKDIWISNATIFFDGLPLSVNANSDITFNGDPLLVTGGNQTISTSGNVDAGNIIVTGDTNSDSFSGNTANFAGNVDAGNITIGGNVTANYYEGNTANFSGNVTVSGVLTNNYFFANGAPVSFDGTYSNSNVANYLPTYTGNIDNVDSVTSTGNITVGTGAFFIGDGGLLSNISGGGGNYSNANVANYLPTYTGDLANVNMANSLGVLMGTPTQGSLVSNAVTLTTTTALTNGIALLNNVLGKLVPPSPPQFPASQTLSVTGLATYRMANTSQVDNIPSGGHTVAGGATVTSVKRTAAYATNTIATAGPGDSGTVTALRNEAAAGSVTLTGSSNGTYGNLVITNNQDYNTSNSSIAAGFWFVFSSTLSGTVPAGWNSAQITDTAANSTNQVVWYYDASAPGTPQFSSVTMTPPGSPTVIYSSTVPNYTNVNQFSIGFTANRLSGDMYPTSDTFATGTAAGAFAAPASRTYQLSSLGTNVLTPNASASVTTTSTIISGFGSSATAPTISVVNSYATGTQVLTAALGNIVLYKTGTSSTMEETNITIGSPIGSGTTPAFRIDNPGSGDTPVFAANEPAFNSQTGPLETYDATIVAAILKHDQTNYSTGYLPVGPNLSVGRTGAQYFTFKFVRTATSKFDIKFSGTIAGMWIALPGSVIDTASTLNGWIDASINYAGSGVPGASIPGGGNGSNGCGLGSTAPLNTLSTNVSTTCTFGTASSSSTATNEIYVRIKLTAGQTVTALSLQTGSR
jgi:hypothetical protein